MKKYIIVFLLGFIIVAGIGVSIGYGKLSDANKAMFNPFIKDEHWYVQVDSAGIINESDTGLYDYKLPAVNDKNERKDIEFAGLKKLREDAYLRIKEKSGFVIGYEEVKETEVPRSLLKD